MQAANKQGAGTGAQLVAPLPLHPEFLNSQSANQCLEYKYLNTYVLWYTSHLVLLLHTLHNLHEARAGSLASPVALAGRTCQKSHLTGELAFRFRLPEHLKNIQFAGIPLKCSANDATVISFHLIFEVLTLSCGR